MRFYEDGKYVGRVDTGALPHEEVEVHEDRTQNDLDDAIYEARNMGAFLGFVGATILWCVVWLAAHFWRA